MRVSRSYKVVFITPQCQISASRMITGIGTPNSQSSIPRPMTSPYPQIQPNMTVSMTAQGAGSAVKTLYFQRPFRLAAARRPGGVFFARAEEPPPLPARLFASLQRLCPI
jgi:hypothetical protein